MNMSRQRELVLAGSIVDGIRVERTRITIGSHGWTDWSGPSRGIGSYIVIFSEKKYITLETSRAYSHITFFMFTYIFKIIKAKLFFAS